MKDAIMNKLANKIDFENIVYINRDIDIDRKLFMEEQFDKYKVNPSRFSAITSDFNSYSSDWESILQNNNSKYVDYDSPLLTKAEIGCLLSHLECIRIYGEKDLVVFEDDLDVSVSEYWNFSLSDVLSKLENNVQILQMVKYPAFTPIGIKKLIIQNDGEGSWGTAAYFIRSSLSKEIVSKYYVDGKWQILKMPCFWTRRTADTILYSYEQAYTCTLFSLAQTGDSTINGNFNPSVGIGEKIFDYFKNNEITIDKYFN